MKKLTSPQALYAEIQWLRGELKEALLSERFLKRQLENHSVRVTNCTCGLCQGIQVTVDESELTRGAGD